jgi:3-mercaptopyruvate sulfurtransferase SseA
MPKKSPKKQDSKTAVLIVMAGGLLLIAFAINLASQNASATPTSTASVALSEEELDARVPRVSLVEAKAALDARSAIFLDVRSPDAYQLEHIAGAINIPLGAIESRLSELDPGQWIITYCT